MATALQRADINDSTYHNNPYRKNPYYNPFLDNGYNRLLSPGEKNGTGSFNLDGTPYKTNPDKNRHPMAVREVREAALQILRPAFPLKVRLP